MNFKYFLLTVFYVIGTCVLVVGVELTFELPDNQKQCFYENIPLNLSATLEFQVVAGGHYDVDVSLQAPNKQIIYEKTKAQLDKYIFVPKIAGVFAICFSNEFSTFSHKIVYMSFKVGEEKSWRSKQGGVGEHVQLMTQMESSTQEIYKHLLIVHEYQTYHRLREAKGRSRAEDLNSQVLWWSILEIIAILLSAIGQVLIVIRYFSTDKTVIQKNKT